MNVGFGARLNITTPFKMSHQSRIVRQTHSINPAVISLSETSKKRITDFRIPGFKPFPVRGTIDDILKLIEMATGTGKNLDIKIAPSRRHFNLNLMG